MISAAAVYLIIEFQRPNGPVEVLPMAAIETCQQEADKAMKAYSPPGSMYKIWAYCVSSGLKYAPQ